MSLLRNILVGLTLALLVGMFLAPAQADVWNKKTVVTFNQPIEIPGKALPTGTYTFQLLDTVSYRHIVQVWNEDGTELITTILAIPNYRLEPTGETVMNFHERPGICPVALRAWFYPGDNFGHEFVYPKERAAELAEKCKEIVPAETVTPTESNLRTVPLEAITPAKKEEPVAEGIQVLPTHVEETAIPAKELPKTGSLTPLFGLLGLVSIGLAFALKLMAKQLS